MNCRKCGSANFGVQPNKKNPNATDLYCKDCGAWLKFATKDEIRLYKSKEATLNCEFNKLVEIISEYFRNFSSSYNAKGMARYIFDEIKKE